VNTDDRVIGWIIHLYRSITAASPGVVADEPAQLAGSLGSDRGRLF
jgi:glutamate dehydrogenase/leucine dehydrogenase